MSNVISLEKHRTQRDAEAHARALVIFEGAAALARQASPELLYLIEQSFGAGWIEERVRATLAPRLVENAPLHPSATRRPVG